MRALWTYLEEEKEKKKKLLQDDLWSVITEAGSHCN